MQSDISAVHAKSDDLVRQSASDSEFESEFSLVDAAIALGGEKVTLIVCVLLGLVAGGTAAVVMKPVFTAKTVIMLPQQQQSSAAAALASLGALAGAAGAVGGVKTPEEMYIALLGSDRIQTSIVNRFKLQERYDQKLLVDTKAALDQRAKFSSNKKAGLITIEVDDREPAFAAQLANAYTEELQKLLAVMAISEAQQRRQFFEQQVSKAKDQLAKAEMTFKQAQQRNGLLVTAALAETGVRASVELRTQIASREVQLQALRGTYATAQNSDVLRISSELSAMRGQLSKLEQGTPGAANIDAPGSTPSAGQDAVRAFRDMKVQEALLEGLVRQFELARVDEARDGPLLQQLDIATPPEKKSKPKRSILILGALFAGLLVGLLIAFVRITLRQRNATGKQSKLVSLRKAWWFQQKA